jgi:hypothetical protein
MEHPDKVAIIRGYHTLQSLRGWEDPPPRPLAGSEGNRLRGDSGAASTAPAPVPTQLPPGVQSQADRQWSRGDFIAHFAPLTCPAPEAAHAAYLTLRSHPAPHTPVIVTGASDNHALILQRALLDSVLAAEGPRRVIMYDLGLSQAWLQDVAAHPAVLEMRVFNFSAYPAYFNISHASGRGQYAWKPAIIAQVLAEYDAVLWLDAGNRVTAGGPWVSVAGSASAGAGAGAGRAPLFARLYSDGFVSSSSSGTVQRWTHPGTLAHAAHAAARAAGDAAVTRDPVSGDIKFPDELLSRPNCNGAIVGFYRRHAAYRRIFLPWLACALDLACIAPPGSNRDNHRQDQAALTALVALAGERYAHVCAQRSDRSWQPARIVPHFHVKGVDQW